MVQSGLPDEWWDCEMECFCYLHNVHDKMASGKTAYEQRLGVQIDGAWIPFGAKVSCKPISSKDEAGLHEFGKMMLLGIFMGYVLRAAGGWPGDCSSRIVKTSSNFQLPMFTSKRFKHQEVAKEGALLFPCADGPLKLFFLPQSPRGGMPRENHEQEKRSRRGHPFSKKKTVNTFGA